MNGENDIHSIEMVRGIIDEAYCQLLERAVGVRYLWGEIVAIDEDDLKETSEAVMHKLTGIGALLDAVAGSLDGLAGDMETCERKLVDLLRDKTKAA